MPLENWIQHSGVDQFLYDWQTGLAGAAALLAALIAVGVTRRQIVATREQTALTEHLEKDRRAREASAFYALLAEAMKRVIAEADRARRGLFGRLRASSSCCPRPRCSPEHHQRRVRGIARRLRPAGRPFDRRVSRSRARDRQLRGASEGTPNEGRRDRSNGQGSRSGRTACPDRKRMPPLCVTRPLSRAMTRSLGSTLRKIRWTLDGSIRSASRSA